MFSRTAAAILLLLTPAAAAAATLPARTPGLWQSTTSVTGPDGKPVPHGTNVVTISCVDPATDLKFFTSGDSACPDLSITGSFSHFVIDGACAQLGQHVQIHETLDYASPQSVTINASLDSGNGPVNVVSHLAWQGACLPGMKPGDEGSIVGGVFVKSDNINDPANQ